MLDPVIENFLKGKKEKWLKEKMKKNTSLDKKVELEKQAEEKFSFNIWLPTQADLANQIAITTHPAKFSYPSIKKEHVFFIKTTSKAKPDGFVRSGNIETEIDAFGNATGIPLYEFMTLKLNDGRTILQHLEEDTDGIKEILKIPNVSYEDLRNKLLSVTKYENQQVRTHERIKQVYFPVGDVYHLLSILSPSGIVFKLKGKINSLKFSDETKKEASESKKKNIYHEKGFSDIYDLCVIGFGGTNSQNISVLNSKNGGKAYLMLSMPPELISRNIFPPHSNFFSNNIRPNAFKDDFLKLHSLLSDDLNNMHIRKKRDRITKNIIYQVTDKMWMIRSLDAGWSDAERYFKLPQHQKIWLDQKYSAIRNETEWFDQIKTDFGRWFINTYKFILGKNAIILGDQQLPYLNEILDECKEAIQ